MKRISALILALLLLLSLAACSGDDSGNAEKKKIEQALGDVTQLPMDFASNVERIGALGADVLRGAVQNSGDEVSCELAISAFLSEAEGSIVLADYRICVDAKLQSGEEYPLTLHGLLVGTSQDDGEGNCLIHYIGGNFELSVEAQDAQSVRERLADEFEAKLSELNQSGIFHSGLSRSDEKLFLSLVRGKRVWLSSEGGVWESLEIAADIKAVYDADSGTFKTTKYQPASDSSPWVRTYDSEGRIETETLYNSETGAIEEVVRYVYPGDGTRERYYTSYDVSTGSVRWESYHRYPGEDADKYPEWEEGWSKVYGNPDGSVSEEEITNRDGTVIDVEYDETGVIRRRTKYEDKCRETMIYIEDYANGVLCYKTIYDDAGEIYEDYENGVLFRKTMYGDGGILWIEEYDENGVPHRVK